MAGMGNNITTSEEQTDQNYFDFQNLALGFLRTYNFITKIYTFSVKVMSVPQNTPQAPEKPCRCQHKTHHHQ